MLPKDGYSLLELLVTLSVAVTVLLVGLPPLGDFVSRNRLVAEVNALHHVLHLGRQEAIKRRLDLVLCQSADGRQCTNGEDWGAGWILFVDVDGDLQPAGGDTERILRRHDPALHVSIRTNRNRFVLRGVRRRNTNGTFLVCDRADRVEPRALVVSYTGRPRSAPPVAAPTSLSCP